ncbi:MAG: hypothetical protein ABEK50_13270 [bacterium]
MSLVRVRMKWDQDPTRIWRDVELGSERTLGHLASVFTPDVGLLDTGHLWFFGVDGKYWNSPIMYLHPMDYRDTKAKKEDPMELGMMVPDAEIHNADETTFEDLDLEEGDRLTYLFDYGDEWRFYLIVKEIDPDGPFDRSPEITKRKGGYLNQYMRSPEEPLVYSEEEWKKQMGSSADNSSIIE